MQEKPADNPEIWQSQLFWQKYDRLRVTWGE